MVLSFSKVCKKTLNKNRSVLLIRVFLYIFQNKPSYPLVSNFERIYDGRQFCLKCGQYHFPLVKEKNRCYGCDTDIETALTPFYSTEDYSPDLETKLTFCCKCKFVLRKCEDTMPNCRVMVERL